MEGHVRYTRIGLWWGFLIFGFLGIVEALSVGNLTLTAVLLGMMHLSVLLGSLYRRLEPPAKDEPSVEEE